MRIVPLGCALLLLASAGAAAGREVKVDCDVHSDYDFALTSKSVILTRKDGAPKTVLMRQGRLFIDDRWVEVGAADRERLSDYEREARAMMPLAAKIGQDAADIAFTALGEVAKGFSLDPGATDAKLAQARADLDRSLARSISATHFNSTELGKGIGEAVAGVVPRLMGDIVGGALRAALSGDSSRLERLDNLDARIEALVEPRAKALERNAETLCSRMRALDRIDDALDYRHEGRPLDLLRVETGNSATGTD
jgi:hypothetical protein